MFVRAQHGESGVQLERGLTEAAIDVLQSLHTSISPKRVMAILERYTLHIYELFFFLLFIYIHIYILNNINWHVIYNKKKT